MGLLRKYRNLSDRERWLFNRAVPVVVALRAGLLLLPFRVVVRAVFRVRSGRSNQEGIDTAVRRQVAWAVHKANEVVPGRGACLHEALAAHVLLKRTGFVPELKIGVRRGDTGELSAHAWVEEGGHVVIGGPRSETDTYAVLPDLERITLRL